MLSASLFEILVAEADQHLATLRHETQLLQFDPAHPVSHEMVRASHTLCGIHRTGGFPLVAITAKALEQTLLGLQQHGGPLPSAALPVLQRAVAGLDTFLARIKVRGAFSALDADEAASIQNELEVLRADLAAAVDDAETLAARRADEDDEPRVDGARRCRDTRARRGRRDGSRTGDAIGFAAGTRRGTRAAGRGRVTRAAAGSARGRA